MKPVPMIRAPVTGITLIMLASLFAQAWVTLKLRRDGYDPLYAKDLAFLVGLPILAVLMFPILREHRAHLRSILRVRDLTLRVVLIAVAIGLLVRVAWWCQLVFRVSTGIVQDDDLLAVIGPSFSFGCPPLIIIFLGVLVMAVLVPIVEEVIHRGLIQSALAHRGRMQAILLSTVIFTLLHPPGTYPLAFFFGLVFALQFWHSGILWCSLISHATFNGLVQLDWRCVTGQWNPLAADLPLYTPAIISFLGFVFSVLMVIKLLGTIRNGVR